MGATAGIGEHPLVLLDHAIALVRVVVVVAIWRALLESDAAPSEPSPQAVLTYVVLARVLGEQLAARTEVLTAVWEGTVASRLLRPVSTFGDYLAEMVGGWALSWVTFSVPVLVMAPLLSVSIAPASALRAAAFLISLGLSIAVATAVDFLFALVVISAPENMWSLRMARDSLVPLVSGSVIPLSLLPWQLGDLLVWSPFASMVSAPLRIYTGGGEVGHLLALQAGWAAALWMITRVAWRRSAPRMVSFGG
jgi:ABC-2 type transport system permease protein